MASGQFEERLALGSQTSILGPVEAHRVRSLDRCIQLGGMEGYALGKLERASSPDTAPHGKRGEQVTNFVQSFRIIRKTNRYSKCLSHPGIWQENALTPIHDMVDVDLEHTPGASAFINSSRSRSLLLFGM